MSEDFTAGTNSEQNIHSMYHSRMDAVNVVNPFDHDDTASEFVISQLNKPSSSYKTSPSDLFQKGKIKFLE